MKKRQKYKKIYVHPDFAKGLKMESAITDRSMVDISKEIAGLMFKKEDKETNKQNEKVQRFTL